MCLIFFVEKEKSFAIYFGLFKARDIKYAICQKAIKICYSMFAIAMD
jgi:hypothetical protein